MVDDEHKHEWPTGTEPGMQLFVRDCYEGMFSLANKLAKPGGGVVFTGNPGIGKKFFVFISPTNFFLRKKLVPQLRIVEASSRR